MPSAMHVFETLRTLQFYAVLLHSLCDVQEADLHWSMQPGVTDGCLEFYQTREAALEAYNVADSEWIGLPQSSLVGKTPSDIKEGRHCAIHGQRSAALQVSSHWAVFAHSVRSSVSPFFSAQVASSSPLSAVCQPMA